LSEAWQLGRLPSLLGAAALLFLLTLAAVIVVGGALSLIIIALAAVHLGPLAVLVGVVGGIAAIVVGIWFYIRLSLTAPAVVLERLGPWQAITRSWRLVSGSALRMFGIYLLTVIIVVIASFILEIPFGIVEVLANNSTGSSFGVTSLAATASVGALIVGAIGSIVAGAITRPISAGVTVLLYIDLRMRREGLDLVLQNAAQNQQLTGDELATIWQPTGTGRPAYPDAGPQGGGYPGGSPPGGGYPGSPPVS
jgi:hypothetical protein